MILEERTMIIRMAVLLLGLSLIAGVAAAREPLRRTPPVEQTTGPGHATAAPSRERTGLGFAYQVGTNGNIALRYWSENNNGFEGLFGFCTGNDYREFDLGAKIMGGLKKEQNMLVYAFGMLGLNNWNNAATSQSDTYTLFGGGLGAEFSFAGLPNFGFIMEMGARYTSNTKIFGTYGEWVPNAGVRYYFK